MKFKMKSLSAMGIAVATMLIVFACSTVPEVKDINNNGGGSADTTAPTVAITSPVSNITIDSNSYTISGTASDAGGIDGVYFSRNASPAVKIGSGATWFTNVTGMAEGANTIVVYAKDAAGNQSTTASRLIMVDTGAPVITITPSGDITTNQSFTVNLSVNTNYGYWSTNGISSFVQLAMSGTNLTINADTTLHYYSADLNTTSSTQTIVYRIFSGDTIYVRTTGNDANKGDTTDASLLTIQNAVELVKQYNFLSNVYVEAGIYIQGGGLSNSVVGNNYAGINIIDANNLNQIGRAHV